jgi:hypothetical protein
MTRKQQKLLNCACGDLAKQLPWHGFRLDKEGYRHFFAGTVLGEQPVPAWDYGDGRVGVIYIGRSSKDLNKEQASKAIDMAFLLGDDPKDQHMDSPPVKWCATIRAHRGIRDSEEQM